MQGTAFFQVKINPAANPVVLTPSGTAAAPDEMPDETVGQAIAEFDIVASGGAGSPYTFSVGGTLPPGLELQSDGVATARITGTPTQDGTFDFSVIATDSGGAAAKVGFKKTVK